MQGVALAPPGGVGRIEPFELNVVDRLPSPCHGVALFNPVGAEPCGSSGHHTGSLIDTGPSEYARALRCCRARRIGLQRCPRGHCFNERIFAPGLGTIQSAIGPSDQLLIGMPIGRIHHSPMLIVRRTWYPSMI